MQIVVSDIKEKFFFFEKDYRHNFYVERKVFAWKIWRKSLERFLILQIWILNAALSLTKLKVMNRDVFKIQE